MHLGLDDTVSKREVQKINTYRDVARGFRPTFPPFVLVISFCGLLMYRVTILVGNKVRLI